MKDSLHDFATEALSFSRRVQAGFQLALGLAFALIVLRATFLWGLNWFVMLIDIIFGLGAMGFFVKACEIYATSQQPERPDERERYMRSRLLYMPGKPRDQLQDERRQ